MMERTIGEPREANTRISFGRAKVTVRIEPIDGKPMEFAVPEALGGEVVLDFGDIEFFDDARDPFRLSSLGGVAVLRDLTLRVRGHAEVVT